MKVCSKCLVEKSESEFSKNGSRLRSNCKTCDRRPGVKPRVKVINGEKLCSGCNLAKPISEYFIRKDRPSGVVSRCKNCESKRNEYRIDDIKQYSKNYYIKNKDKVCARSKKQGDLIMEYVFEQKRNKPCNHCGNSFPLECMDFDHLDPTTKSFNLGSARWHSLEEVKLEIAKCQILCANCHRIATKSSGVLKSSRAKQSGLPGRESLSSLGGV